MTGEIFKPCGDNDVEWGEVLKKNIMNVLLHVMEDNILRNLSLANIRF